MYPREECQFATSQQVFHLLHICMPIDFRESCLCSRATNSDNFIKDCYFGSELLIKIIFSKGRQKLIFFVGWWRLSLCVCVFSYDFLLLDETRQSIFFIRSFFPTHFFYIDFPFFSLFIFFGIFAMPLLGRIPSKNNSSCISGGNRCSMDGLITCNVFS